MWHYVCHQQHTPRDPESLHSPVYCVIDKQIFVMAVDSEVAHEPVSTTLRPAHRAPERKSTELGKTIDSESAR